MRKSTLASGFLLVAFLPLPGNLAAEEDARQKVELPARMQAHMLANMRDHLHALSEIHEALGEGDLRLAADIAEARLGMSSLVAHGASHMAPHMPPGMRAIGTQMHQAASRFALSAQNAAVDGDLKPALADLAGITWQCIACHGAYRIH
jgi:hypothetical protein